MFSLENTMFIYALIHYKSSLHFFLYASRYLDIIFSIAAINIFIKYEI